VCIVVGATTLVLFTIEQASSAESSLMPVEQEQSEYLKEGGKDRLDEGVEIDPLMVRVCFITSVVMVCVFVLSKQIK
jgi:hypothetical protein